MDSDTSERRAPGASSEEGSSRPSGRFLLRIDPELHLQLRRRAEEADLSLNEYCARQLAASGGLVPAPLAEAVVRSRILLRGGLVGAVAFGSWARGETAAGSDVDLLLVVDPSLPVTRDLYRPWDREPILWESHRIEPHFVHLPASSDASDISGLWAEAAVDGIVLSERELAVSRLLAAVRRRIAEGRIVRRESHGHPYWVEAA